jgi:hypothetical protein
MTNRQRLGRILLVKERLRDVRRAELACAEAAVSLAQSAAQNAARERDSAIVTLTEPGEATGDDLARRAVLVALASRMANQAEVVVAERQAERDQRAATTAGAVREVRALECLRSRLERREGDRDRDREQAETDEAAARIGAAR